MTRMWGLWLVVGLTAWFSVWHVHQQTRAALGGVLGNNDVSKLHRAIRPCQKLLASARSMEMLVVHTREGHRPDLSDLHAYKNQRPGCSNPGVIGTSGPLGRILVRGEEGHDIIPELYPIPGEPIIDKLGKGTFYATDMECMLREGGEDASGLRGNHGSLRSHHDRQGILLSLCLGLLRFLR